MRLLLAACAVSLPSSAQERIPAEAVEAWRAYEAWQPCLQGTVSSVTTGTVSRSVTRWGGEVRQRPGAARYSERASTGGESWLIVNSRYAAEVVRPRGGVSKLEWFAADPGATPGLHAPTTAETIFHLTSPHFCYDHLRLSAWAASPGLDVRRVERVPDRVIVAYTFTDRRGRGQRIREGELTLDPSQGWCVRALRESEQLKIPEGAHAIDREVTYQFAAPIDGFAVVRRQEERTTGFNARTDRDAGARLETDYQFAPGPPADEADFTLSALGLPEPADPGSKLNSARRPWLTSLVGATAVGWLIWRRRRPAGRVS